MDCLFRVKTITLRTANVTNCHVIATDILLLSSNHRSVQFLYLAASIRNDSWKNDHDLEDILRKYVREGLQREEILDFVSRDFSQYAWSLRKLDRRLHHFQICHTDRNVTVDDVEAAVKKN